MCFNQEDYGSPLFLNLSPQFPAKLSYQYSMIVQIRCELTELNQQQIFQITIISKLSIGQCYAESVNRPLLLSS